MIVIGIDPGIAITGYGVIEYIGNKYKVLDYGAINTKAGLPLSDRLLTINTQLLEIIEKFKPHSFAIEELFFNKNVKTALTVAHGRGVAILSAATKGIEVFEYTPLQVKQGVVGYGGADKKQVQNMVKAILCLPQIPKPDDVADALAIAICHANSHRMGAILKLKY